MNLNSQAKTSVAVKICGITKIDQALEISGLGVDAIGVIGVENSPRFLSEEKASKLFSKIKLNYPEINRVLVVSNIDDIKLEKALINQGNPSVIQLHGEESPKRCKELREKYPKTKFWKAFRVKSTEDLELIKSYESFVDAFLLDAWSLNKIGGTGEIIPINLLENSSFSIPWWLAGGMNADLIPATLEKVNPFGIDASSKLEISTGIKNIDKVKELIRSIKYFSA